MKADTNLKRVAERQPIAKVAEDQRAAEAKRKADEEERQRVTMIEAEEERRRAEQAKKRAEVDLLRPGRVFRDCPDVCPEMVVVPAGEFTMGSNEHDSEKPAHKVTIARPLAVGKFEVTFAEWDICVDADGCRHRPDRGWGGGRHPVINVSWHDANEYAVWLSRKTGRIYRLLSEAEWEYAAWAGTTTRTISAGQAKYGGFRAEKVGSFLPNKFGLHDLHGNVWEWVEDNWHPNYEGAPIDGSAWQGGDTPLRVLRGGSWSDVPINLRSGRTGYHPGSRIHDVGFRLSRTL